LAYGVDGIWLGGNSMMWSNLDCFAQIAAMNGDKNFSKATTREFVEKEYLLACGTVA
jgi:hypothetical protein